MPTKTAGTGIPRATPTLRSRWTAPAIVAALLLVECLVVAPLLPRLRTLVKRPEAVGTAVSLSRPPVAPAKTTVVNSSRTIPAATPVARAVAMPVAIKRAAPRSPSPAAVRFHGRGKAGEDHGQGRGKPGKHAAKHHQKHGAHGHHRK